MMGKTMAKGLRAAAALALAVAACLAAGLGVWQASAEEAANGVAVSTAAHMQTYGDSDGDGGLAGLPGEDKRLEALAVSVEAPEGVDLGVSYSVYSEGYGWLEGADGVLAGTSGESLSISRVVVELTGDDAGDYAVWYRAWVDGYGWTGWACGGQECGTHSSGATVEAVEVVVLPAGESPSGDVTPRVVTSAATYGEAEGADGDVAAGTAEGADDDAADDDAAEDADDDALETATEVIEETASGGTSATGSSSSVGSSSEAASSSGTTDGEDDVSGWPTVEQEAEDHDHVYSESHVDATCGQLGYTVYTCTVCGYVCYGEPEYGDLPDHDYVSVTTAEGDGLCTTTYTTTYTCTVCGNWYTETETVVEHGETYCTYLHRASSYGCAYAGAECTICGSMSSRAEFLTLEELEEHYAESGIYLVCWFTDFMSELTDSADPVFGDSDYIYQYYVYCSVCGEELGYYSLKDGAYVAYGFE